MLPASHLMQSATSFCWGTLGHAFCLKGQLLFCDCLVSGVRRRRACGVGRLIDCSLVQSSSFVLPFQTNERHEETFSPGVEVGRMEGQLASARWKKKRQMFLGWWSFQAESRVSLIGAGRDSRRRCLCGLCSWPLQAH